MIILHNNNNCYLFIDDGKHGDADHVLHNSTHFHWLKFVILFKCTITIEVV